MPSPTPTSGKDELRANVIRLLKTVTAKDAREPLAYIDDLMQLIAASNQQAVQKELENLIMNAQLYTDVSLEADAFDPWAVPVSAIESALAAAQPRKDGDE